MRGGQIVKTLIGIAVAGLVVAGAAAAVIAVPAGSSSSARVSGAIPCHNPTANRIGQPTIAVVLLDGVPSQEDGGKHYPFPVPHPVSRQANHVRSALPAANDHADGSGRNLRTLSRA